MIEQGCDPLAAIRARLEWTLVDMAGLAARDDTSAAALCVIGRARQNLAEIAQLLAEFAEQREAA
jgi:hypothetical protein